LGVDPGSTATGWAAVVVERGREMLEDAGVLRLRPRERSVRLAELERRFEVVVARVRPEVAAVEASFSGRNPRSGLLLAESRGVLLAVLGRHGIPVSSYSPAAVKAAIVGYGRAEKRQIVYMVTRLLGLESPPASDAADAIAVALTHVRVARRPGLVEQPSERA
jgi:crossover junction endodeoxyribonuclease RuvC